MFRTMTAAMLTVGCLLGGCSSSTSVSLAPSAAVPTVKAVHVVVPTGTSEDVSAAVQRAFLDHGYAVTASAEPRAGAGVGGVVRFADRWRWDMAMYLYSLDVQLYQADGSTLVGSASWRNAHFHGFQSPEWVAKQVVDELFKKLGAGK